MRILYVNRKLSVFERFDCTGNGVLHSFLCCSKHSVAELWLTLGGEIISAPALLPLRFLYFLERMHLQKTS